MPAIVPGYEYDIFISYRQKDNRSDQWVTQFVQALKEELDATFKEDISVYFDENPHDGLLETHQVDATLAKKLKCLVFIPIISQTYCDTKSFAWSHEFLPFINMAQEDELGMNVTLANGNVASRVLPIQIHKLDDEDQSTLEKELGGPLRSIKFIHQSAGVNRSLTKQDDQVRESGKILYSDQINKVANALKEIGAAIYQNDQHPEVGKVNTPKITSFDETVSSNMKRFSYLSIAIALIIGLTYFWFKYNSKNKPIAKAEIDKSLVVLPFTDMSPNQDHEWFSDGLAEELLNRLSRVSELKLISRTTAFAFKGKGLTAKKIADSLGVSYVLEGSVRKANNQLRITVQLIRAEDDTHIWSNTYDYGMDSIFAVQEDISENITKALNILLDEKKRAIMFESGTYNVEAYEEYLKGKNLYEKAHVVGNMNLLTEANKHFEKAIYFDNEFADAYYKHLDIYSHDIIGGDNIRSLMGLSQEKKYELLVKDFDAAIKFTKSEDKKIIYQVDKNLLSDDWHELPKLLSKLKQNNLSAGWDTWILIFTDPGYLFKHRSESLINDPLNELNIYISTFSLIRLNLLDSASSYFENQMIEGFMGFYLKSHIELNKQEYDKAFDLVNRSEFEGTYHYLLVSLLAQKNEMNYNQLETLIDSTDINVDSFGCSPIQIYNVLGEYNKADSIASIIDSNFLGYCSIAAIVATYGLNFHLDATPNYKTRLIELGIDPEAFEKKHYYQFPVVKVE